MDRSTSTNHGGAASTSNVARVVSMLYQRAAVRAAFSPETEEILWRCDEDLLEVLRVHEAQVFPPFIYCQMCNGSQQEMDLLFSSGICMSVHFSRVHLTFLIYMFIFVLALLGNSILLYILVSDLSLRTANSLFTANLAVGDLLNVVLSVPFSVLSIVVLQYWPFGAGFCVFVNYLQGASVSATALTLLVVSVDRYLDVIRPSRPRMTPFQAKVILALVWGWSLLVTLPMAVFSRLDPPENRMLYGQFCRVVWPAEYPGKCYTLTLTVLQYFLPLLVLIFTSSRICWEVWRGRSEGSTRHLQEAQVPAVETGRGAWRESPTTHSPAKMVAEVLLYSVCWLPYNILLVVLESVENVESWPHVHPGYLLLHLLMLSQACHNPFIVCWSDSNIRKQYLQVLHHLLPCCHNCISRHLLTLRQSSGPRRLHAHTFGSTGTFRNLRRFSFGAWRRRHSSGTFRPIQTATGTPVGVCRTYSSDLMVNDPRHKPMRSLSDSHIPEEAHTRSLQPTAVTKRFGN